jgi:hypothetical protein
MPICILGDSLYASESVLVLFKKNNWVFWIHYKDRSIPSVAEEFKAIKGLNEVEECVV